MFDLNTSVCLKRHMLRLLHLKVDKRIWFAIEYVNLKHDTTYFKNIYFRIQLKQAINIYIFTCKHIKYIIEWMSEWVKIHYLQWMLNNIYNVPDNNDLFFIDVCFGEDKKGRKFSWCRFKSSNSYSVCDINIYSNALQWSFIFWL